MKTYYLTLSQTFPAKHKKAGQPTFFKDKFHAAITHNDEYWNKLHTIRANYPLWKKRFEQIERGEACLSVRQWSGKPYRSKQIEIVRLTKANGIGIQKLEYNFAESLLYVGYQVIDPESLAHNDGLTRQDWENWFKGYDFTKPLAIIHFTSFRY